MGADKHISILAYSHMVVNVLVEVEEHGGVPWIYINRPSKKNAFSPEVGRALHSALETVEKHPSHVAVLTGRGAAFSSGGDIGVMHRAENLPETLRELSTWAGRCALRIYNMDKIIVAAANGPAVGAGLGIFLSCDLRVCSEKSVFAAGYSSLGLGPGSASYHLPRIAGLAAAQKMMFTGERISPEEALELGIVHAVGEYPLIAEEYARRVARMPSEAVRLCKKVLRHSMETLSFEEQVEREASAIEASGRTANAREGITAFLEKRQPRFNQ